MTVGAGCLSDPRQIPGISHLVSASILGNSKKYPDKVLFRSTKHCFIISIKEEFFFFYICVFFLRTKTLNNS